MYHNETEDVTLPKDNMDYTICRSAMSSYYL